MERRDSLKELPKYMVIANQLRQKIKEGEFSKNEQLPQETRLMNAYNVSRITIRKALDILVSDDLIYRVQGAGTFVKSNDRNSSVVQKNQAELFDIESLKVKIDNFSVIKPSEKISDIMGVNQYDFVYLVDRTLFFEESPVIYQQFYFPIKYIQGIRLDALKGSITEFLMNELGVDITFLNRTFRIDHLNLDQAAKLKLKDSNSVLLIEEKITIRNGAIGVYDLNWINTDLYQYDVKILLK